MKEYKLVRLDPINYLVDADFTADFLNVSSHTLTLWTGERFGPFPIRSAASFLLYDLDDVTTFRSEMLRELRPGLADDEPLELDEIERWRRCQFRRLN